MFPGSPLTREWQGTLPGQGSPWTLQVHRTMNSSTQRWMRWQDTPHTHYCVPHSLCKEGIAD